MFQASHFAVIGLVAVGTLAAPRLAAAQCHDYVRRVYTAPVVVSYAEPAYRVVSYPVYAEPVYVAPPVYTTYSRCYQPAVQVSVHRDYGHSHGYREYRSQRSHRGWSAGVRFDKGRCGRGWEFNVRRHRD